MGALLIIPATAGFAGIGVARDLFEASTDLNVTKTIIADGTTDSVPVSDIGIGTTDVPGTTTATTLKVTIGARPETPTTTSVATTLVKSTTTSCKEVLYIGDSTSTGLIGGKYLLPADQIPAQHARVGATTQHYEIAGGRSINEGYLDARPAKRSAEKWKSKGYSGCWVLALGTMDAAAVFKGTNPGIRARIKMMMDIVGDDPVMWVNLKGRRGGGPWGARSLSKWNKMLLQACAEHPNMRIYDWAADVKKNWYVSDGIHQNTPGYVARARNIADALAQAFPAKAPAAAPTSCLVEI